jgi:peptide/nickel transport system substrate-binding protein/oligopeptide transport system substrate-binding protein
MRRCGRWRATGRGAGAGKRALLTIALCLLIAGPAVAPGQEQGQDAPARGGVYRRPLRQDPVTLDPARVSDIYGRSVSQQIFDGLVQFDNTLTVVPALAQFWRASRDGLTWTFHLRQGVRFHHGRELTADDVVYSLTRLLDPRVRSGAATPFGTVKGAAEFREGRAKHVAGLVVLDRHTVQITLTESIAPFVSLLAVGHAKIVPRELVEQQGEGFGSHPVGTGPFKFLRWDRGTEIVLAANPAYFGGSPRLSRIVYRVFPGALFDTVYDEFRKGALEDTPIPARLTLQEYQRVVRDRSHQYVKRPMFSVRFYGINTRLSPLDDPRVRLALLHAIDRERIVDDFYVGRYVLARGVLPPGTPGYNPKLAPAPHDPSRARELLAQAGYPGGARLPTLDVWSVVNDQRAVTEHQQITRWLEAIGVRVKFHYQTDWPTFSKALAEGRYPIFLYAWYADAPDPDNFLTQLFHSQSARNLFGYRNRAVDDLLGRARLASDPQQRAELYRRAEQFVVADAPIIPVWHYTYERLFQPYVRSVEVNGLGDPYIPLRKVWLDRR